jgi:hypothetical protein
MLEMKEVFNVSHTPKMKRTAKIEFETTYFCGALNVKIK